MLQRLAKLVEQARVLDGDDGLAGEVRDQLDVLVGEGAFFLAIDGDGADQLALLQHRHGNQGADPRDIHSSNRQWVAAEIGKACPQVFNVDWVPSRGSTRKGHVRARAKQRVSPSLGICRWHRAMKCHGTKRISFLKPQDAITRLAESCRVLQHGLEDGLQLAWRA